MKRRLVSILLVVVLLTTLGISASAVLDTDDFHEGRFSGILLMEDGRFLVTDVYNKVMWTVQGKTVEKYAGLIPVPDISGEPQGVYHDGTAENAGFVEPWAIAPYLDGYAVTDAGANVVRYVTSDRVYTIAGSGRAGNLNGSSQMAAFNRPTGLAADEGGNLYVADTNNGAIRKIDKNGRVTTYADGLSEPTGLYWQKGALYVAETGKSRIVKIVSGTVQQVAGIFETAEDVGVYYGGYADGPTARARFDHPQGLLVAEDGTIYVSDTFNSAIRMIKGERVYTLMRISDTTAVPMEPRGMVLSEGILYVADAFAGQIVSVKVAAKVYEDVGEGDWYAGAVENATLRGLTNGVDETHFAPSGTTTRAMAVTMLSRLCQNIDGNMIINGEGTFEDVPDDAWFAAAVRWAVDAGITNGVGNGFAPDDTLTRETLVTMLYRFAKYLNLDVSVGEDSNMLSFADVTEIDEWALPAMTWAVETGIVNGSDGALSPRENTDRSQCAKILVAFMDSYGF